MTNFRFFSAPPFHFRLFALSPSLPLFLSSSILLSLPLFTPLSLTQSLLSTSYSFHCIRCFFWCFFHYSISTSSSFSLSLSHQPASHLLHFSNDFYDLSLVLISLSPLSLSFSHSLLLSASLTLSPGWRLILTVKNASQGIKMWVWNEASVIARRNFQTGRLSKEFDFIQKWNSGREKINASRRGPKLPRISRP